MTLDDSSVVAGRARARHRGRPDAHPRLDELGAGVVGARAAGAADVVDPTPYAVGSLVGTFERYPNARGILPAMGYGEEQTRDLEATVRAMVQAGVIDAVVSGTPVDLTLVLSVDVPLVRARYSLREQRPGRLDALLRAMLAR